jgi:hypothetical protein
MPERSITTFVLVSISTSRVPFSFTLRIRPCMPATGYNFISLLKIFQESLLIFAFFVCGRIMKKYITPKIATIMSGIDQLDPLDPEGPSLKKH